MVQMRTVDDDSGGTSPNAGSSGGPAAINPGWLDINWVFPTSMEYLILHFEVIAYTGYDPTDGSTYLFQPVKVPANMRRLVKSILPKATLATVNASVRAVYA